MWESWAPYSPIQTLCYPWGCRVVGISLGFAPQDLTLTSSLLLYLGHACVGCGRTQDCSYTTCRKSNRSHSTCRMQMRKWDAIDNQSTHTSKQSHTRRTSIDLHGSALQPTSIDQREKALPHFDSFIDTRIQVFITNTNHGKLSNYPWPNYNYRLTPMNPSD